MGFLKKLGKKLKKAAKKVAKVTPAGSTLKATKAIKKGKLSAAVKAVAPVTYHQAALSGPGILTLAKGGSLSRASDAGVKAGVAGAVALGVAQATSGFMGRGATIQGPPEIGASEQAGSNMGFLDNVGSWARDAGNFAGEIGSTAGQLRDTWTQLTGAGGGQQGPPAEPLESSAAQAQGMSTQQLLLIGGGVLLLVLLLRKG